MPVKSTASTNLLKVIASTSLLDKFGYHNLVQRFGLVDISDKNTVLKDLYNEVYEGLCDPNDRFQLHLASAKHNGTITYIIHDAEINDNVAVFARSSFVRKSTLYPDWGIIVPWSDEVTVYDSKNEQTHLVINDSLGEDEHFQLMMERDVPEYESVQKVLEYTKTVHPYLISYVKCSIIDYDHLDIDFEEFSLSEDFFAALEDQYPGLRKAFIEAVHNGTKIDYQDLF